MNRPVEFTLPPAKEPKRKSEAKEALEDAFVNAGSPPTSSRLSIEISSETHHRLKMRALEKRVTLRTLVTDILERDASLR